MLSEPSCSESYLIPLEESSFSGHGLEQGGVKLQETSESTKFHPFNSINPGLAARLGTWTWTQIVVDQHLVCFLLPYVFI